MTVNGGDWRMANNTCTVMLKLKTDRSLRLSLGALMLLEEVMDLIPDWHAAEKEKVRRRGVLLTSEIRAELVLTGTNEKEAAG